MELKVLLFDRLSVVVAVGAPRLSTPESLLIASRMPEESRGWSSILIVVWVSTAAKWVKWFASRSVEKTGSDWAADKTCFGYSMTMQMAVK